MQRPTRKLLAPLVLAALGTWLLVGCVYIPTFGPSSDRKNASRSVGSKDSRRPVRVTHSTLGDVVRVLGEPEYATADRRVIAYAWTVQNGVTVWPLCFAAQSVKGRRTLVLRFDDREVLRSFRILRSDDAVVSLYPVIRRTPLPEEIEQELRAAGMREAQLRRSSTRPTSTPQTQPR